MKQKPQTSKSSAGHHPFAPIKHDLNVSYTHAIYFTDHIFDPNNPLLQSVIREKSNDTHPAILIVLDRNLAHANPDLKERIQGYFSCYGLEKSLAGPVLIPGGETAKNDPVIVADLYALIDKMQLCRHSYLVAAGGGAVLDTAGLAAATAHRGIRHIRIPTTVLAQNDAGVGIKNSINFFGKKNFVGTFAPPEAVINDFSLLASLSAREKRSGLAEAVKVALIKDVAFFEELESHADALAAFEETATRRMIYQTAQLHANHIATAGDPFERGNVRPLDFGHWSAHKLETLSNYRLLHGEAVAIGLAVDTLYSMRKKDATLDEKDAERVLALLKKLGFRLFSDELTYQNPDGQLLILDGLDEFRQHMGGQLAIPILNTIGQVAEVHEMDIEIIAEVIDTLRQR